MSHTATRALDLTLPEGSALQGFVHSILLDMSCYGTVTITSEELEPLKLDIVNAVYQAIYEHRLPEVAHVAEQRRRDGCGGVQ